MENKIYVRVVTLLLTLVEKNGPDAAAARKILVAMGIEVA